MAEPGNNPIDRAREWASGWRRSFERLRQQVGTPAAVLLAVLIVVVVGWWNWPAIRMRPGVEGIIARIIQPATTLNDSANLLKNGGFEDDLKFWGTGYYETDVYHGSQAPFWASRVGTSIDTMTIAEVAGDVVQDIHRSGSRSFRIINRSSSKAHIYGSMSQRIAGLSKNTNYIASFWVKAVGAGRGTFEITTDLKWLERAFIEPGTYDWKQFSHIFNTGDKTFIDFRIISEEAGAVWVDDITFKPYLPSK